MKKIIIFSITFFACTAQNSQTLTESNSESLCYKNAYKYIVSMKKSDIEFLDEDIRNMSTLRISIYDSVIAFEYNGFDDEIIDVRYHGQNKKPVLDSLTKDYIHRYRKGLFQHPRASKTLESLRIDSPDSKLILFFSDIEDNMVRAFLMYDFQDDKLYNIISRGGQFATFMFFFNSDCSIDTVAFKKGHMN